MVNQDFVDPTLAKQDRYAMLSESDFKDLCKLARLDPEDESLKGLMGDFNKILDAVETIAELDTSDNIRERSEHDTFHTIRPDTATESLSQDAISKIAPDWESGHFVVPGVIESEG